MYGQKQKNHNDNIGKEIMYMPNETNSKLCFRKIHVISMYGLARAMHNTNIK